MSRLAEKLNRASVKVIGWSVDGRIPTIETQATTNWIRLPNGTRVRLTSYENNACEILEIEVQAKTPEVKSSYLITEFENSLFDKGKIIKLEAKKQI